MPCGDDATNRSHFWLAAAGVMLLTLVVYWPVLCFDFVNWDDPQNILHNPNLNPPTLAGLGNVWLHSHMRLYIPVTYTIWWTAAGMSQMFASGPQSGLFHALNLVAHLLAAMVVFALLRRFVRSTWAAAVGAAAFVVHPVQVESVAWAAGLKDVLCGLLLWTAVRLYVRHVDADDVRRKRLLIAFATFAFVMAMLSKPTAVVTPAIVIVVERRLLRRSWRAAVPVAAAWGLLALPIIVLTQLIQPAEVDLAPVPLHLRPLIATDALAFYIGKLLVPWPLGLDYGRHPHAVITAGSIYYTWLAPAAFVAALWWQRRRAPILAAAGLLALIPLLPVLGLVHFDFQQYSTVADHYLYPAMVGVALAVAWLVSGPQQWPRALATIVIVVLAVVSHMQTWHWRDDRALFEQALRVNPQSWAAHNNLAVLALAEGNPRRAIEHAERALAHNQRHVQAYGNLGVAHAQLGNPAAAVQAWEKALAIDPNDAHIRSELAGLLAAHGDLESAMRHVLLALESDPNHPGARLNLGTMLAQMNQLERAEQELRAAVRLAPTSVQAHTNLGLVLLARGRRDEAAHHFRVALQIDPDSVAAQQGLAEALRR